MLRFPLLLLASFLVASAARSQIQPQALPEFASARPLAAPAMRPYGVGTDARLVFDGQQFLVAFSDSRYGDQDVLGSRYDRRGEPLDQQAFPITATYLLDSLPISIWNGTDYAVFSQTMMLGTFRVRVSRDGVVSSAGDPLPAVYEYAVDGAWNGSQYCVAFLNSAQLTLRFFDATLGEAGTAAIDSASEAVQNAAVATDGRNFLVVWETEKAGDQRGVYALVVDDRGKALSGRQTLAVEAASDGTYTIPRFTPVISWNGSRYLVAWATPTAVKATFVSPAGSATDSFAIPAKPFAGSVATAWDGLAHLITWSDRNTYEVSGALASSTGALLDSFDLGTAAMRAAAASNGDLFLVLAGTDRFAVHSTGATRFERLGASTTAYAAQTDASITAGAQNLLTAWAENGNVYASRMAPDGSALDGSGILLGRGWNGISTASSGDVHAVAWSDSASTRMARVTSAGEVLDPGGAVIADSSGSVVTAGGHALMAAAVVPASKLPTYLFNILAGRVAPTGTSPAPVPVATNVVVKQLQALVETGDGFALLWQQDLDPECISPRCKRFAERLMFLTDTGSVTRDIVLPFNPTGFVGAASDETGILVAGSSNGTLVTERIAFDGTAAPVVTSAIVVPGIRGSLVARTGGFQLFVDWNGPAMLVLDDSGRAIAPLKTLRSTGTLGAAVRAFGSTWMTWLDGWIPLPNAHPGGITRGFVQVIPQTVGRRRAAPSL